MCLTFKVIAQNIVPSSESVKKKKRLMIGTKELCWAHQHRPIYNLRASTSFISESVQVSTTFKAKQWSGLIKDYYLPRWELFFDYLQLELIGKSIFGCRPRWRRRSPRSQYWSPPPSPSPPPPPPVVYPKLAFLSIAALALIGISIYLHVICLH